jgi:hypothetical protein
LKAEEKKQPEKDEKDQQWKESSRKIKSNFLIENCAWIEFRLFIQSVEKMKDQKVSNRNDHYYARIEILWCWLLTWQTWFQREAHYAKTIPFFLIYYLLPLSRELGAEEFYKWNYDLNSIFYSDRAFFLIYLVFPRS